MRSEVAADISRLQVCTELQLEKLLEMFGIKKSTFYDWQNTAKMSPEKNKVFSSVAIRADEVSAVLAYRDMYPDIGYRKFTWQMVDANVAFLSESKVYDILSEHNRLQGWNRVDNGETAKSTAISQNMCITTGTRTLRM